MDPLGDELIGNGPKDQRLWLLLLLLLNSALFLVVQELVSNHKGVVSAPLDDFPDPLFIIEASKTLHVV